MQVISGKKHPKGKFNAAPFKRHIKRREPTLTFKIFNAPASSASEHPTTRKSDHIQLK